LTDEKTYQVIIVGGGLAGLSLAIQLAQNNRSVLLLEKGEYPRHKVCGEYISLESWDFIERLEIPLSNMNLPKIDKLKISSESGIELQSDLDLGGFGISRFVLEELLYKKALELGVTVLTKTKFIACNGVWLSGGFTINTSAGDFNGEILCASFGKYVTGDFYKPEKQKENWVGIKYHIRYEHPANEIVLHNFKNGYCGMSKIEDDKSCLCYLVNAKELKKQGGDIQRLEKNVLRKNKRLDQIFAEAQFLFEKPQVISNVTFHVKKPTYDCVFYLGDSAGTIAPLSGNGMSNAFRSAFLLNKSLNSYFDNKLSFTEALRKYEKDWASAFSARINLGRNMQHFFCKKNLNAASIRILKYAKSIHTYIIRQTHGEPF
jgi:flavin-dependent dehydrogenase